MDRPSNPIIHHHPLNCLRPWIFMAKRHFPPPPLARIPKKIFPLRRNLLLNFFSRRDTEAKKKFTKIMFHQQENWEGCCDKIWHGENLFFHVYRRAEAGVDTSKGRKVPWEFLFFFSATLPTREGIEGGWMRGLEGMKMWRSKIGWTRERRRSFDWYRVRDVANCGRI